MDLSTGRSIEALAKLEAPAKAEVFYVLTLAVMGDPFTGDFVPGSFRGIRGFYCGNGHVPIVIKHVPPVYRHSSDPLYNTYYTSASAKCLARLVTEHVPIANQYADEENQISRTPWRGLLDAVNEQTTL